MAKLSSSERDNLPASAFAIPGKRAYPVHDRSHAADALSRVDQVGTSEEKAQVRAAVCKRYPDFGICHASRVADQLRRTRSEDSSR